MSDVVTSVLLIEDNPGDARLIRELLAEAGATQFRSEEVDTLSAGLARLRQGGIDLVLLDLALPDSGGLDTLERVYAHSPQVPIIVLTGLNDDTLAAAAVRGGAQDYWVKGQMNRDTLVRAIHYAIERKRAEETLRHNRDLLLALSRAGQTVQRARTPEEIYRVVGEEIETLGYSLMIFTFSEDRQYLKVAYTTIAANLLREAERLARLPIQNYRLPIDADTVFSRIAAGGWAEFLSSTTETVAQVLPPVLRPLAGRLTSLLKVERGIVAPLHAGGANFGILTVTASALDEFDVPAVETFAGQVAICLHNARLTQQAQEELAERQRVEDALRENEERYRGLVEQTPDMIGVLVENRLVYLNPAGTRLFGADRPEQMLGKSIAEYVHPDDLPLIRERARRAAEEGKSNPLVEFRIFRQDGAVTEMEGVSIPFVYQGKQAVQFIAHDITERKQAETSARQQSEQLRLLYEASQRLNRTLDLDQIKQTVCDFMSIIAPNDAFAISTFDPKTQLIRCRAYWIGNQWLDVSPFPPIPLEEEGRGTQSVVIRTGQSMLVNDYQAMIKTARVSYYIDDETNQIVDEVPADQPVTRSALIVPLKSAGRVTGAIQAMSYRPDAYTENQLKLLEALALHVASAEQNALLYDQVQRELNERKQAEESLRQRLTELEAVHAVSAALRTAQTVQEALPILLDRTLAAFETDAGVIWLYDIPGGELRATVKRGWFSQLDEPPIKPGEGIAGAVFASGQPHFSAEFVSDPLVRPPTTPEHPTGGEIPAGWGGVCVPIRTAAETVGVLFVSVPTPRQITTEQTRLMTSLTEMAGAALHRMRLYEETTRQLRYLQALHEIDRVISTSFDLRMTLRFLIKHVIDQLGADAAAVLVLHPRLQTLQYVAGDGFRARIIQDSRIRPHENLAGRVVLERRALQIQDSATIQGTSPFATLWAGEEFVSYCGVPLIVKGEVKGVLEVFSRAPHSQPKEKGAYVDLLENFAAQAAIAIDNMQLFEDLQRSNLEMTIAYDSTIEGWSHALDLRDKETKGHTRRVAELTGRLARAVGMGDAELVHIRRGALLHDIGKMGVPDSILLKPGALTEEEWTIMHHHPQLAHDMISSIDYLKPALDIPYCHHEKWDGTGYPRGLKGEQIPLAARLFAVVDVWDALTSDRPYRSAWSKQQALEYIREQNGKHFDPGIVDKCLQEIARE